jgi:hypothetical protein
MGNEKMTTAGVRRALDELLVLRGEKRGSFYRAKFSCKDVLDRVDSKNTPNNLRHVAYIVKREYPDSTMERGSGDSGWILHMKSRTA